MDRWPVERLRTPGRELAFMIVVLSDTHGRDGTRLSGRALEAVSEADAVLHCGDFITQSVVDGFYESVPEFYGVYGNVDEDAVRARLPNERTVELEGVTVAMRHKPEGGDTGLAMFGRERDADLVFHGHTHRPRVSDAGDLLIVNPGSHADPRGNPAAHAELTLHGAGQLSGELVTRDGSVLESFTVGTD